MIRYLGISTGIHVAALAAVFSVASLPHTDVLQSNAGNTVTLTFHGTTNPNRQVVETVAEKSVETARVNLPLEQIRDLPVAQSKANKSVREDIAMKEVSVQSKKTASPPSINRQKMVKNVTASGKVENVMQQKPASPPSSVSSASGGQTIPARNVHCPAPPFPERARRYRIEGQVRVQVHIGESGRVSEVTILKSSGRSDFDRAARATILKHWKYEPALKWGQPTASRETVSVEFRLK